MFKKLKSHHALMLGLAAGVVIGVGGTWAFNYFNKPKTGASGYDNLKKTN
jgi:hypothetical protein